MITKKLLRLVFILLLSVTAAVTAQNPNVETELPESGEETAVSENTREYTPVPEESLIILDNEDPGVLENTTALNTFSVWDFLRMLLVLGAVLGFIYFIFFLLKKAGKPKLISDSTINVISTQNLESGRSLHLIEIGPQIFLIGSGESSVQLISEITNKETLDTIKLDKSARSESNNTFTDIFRGFFKKENSSISLAKPDQVSFMKKQRERLRNM